MSFLSSLYLELAFASFEGCLVELSFAFRLDEVDADDVFEDIAIALFTLEGVTGMLSL